LDEFDSYVGALFDVSAERERMLDHLVQVLKTLPTGLRLVIVGNLCVACETPNKHANI
jgi:hypothetical protein